MAIEKNKAVVRRYFEEVHNQRAETILEGIIVSELRVPTRQATERLRAAFPDYQITIDEQVAEVDKVATVWTGRGTHRGEWASPIGPIPATERAAPRSGRHQLTVVPGESRM